MKSTKLKTNGLVRALALAGLVTASLPGYAATYQLRAEAVNKEMPDGTMVPMWGYALDGASCVPVAPATTCPATVPGPDLVVPPGDSTLNVTLSNTLGESVSIVIPGLGLPKVNGAAAQPEGFVDSTGRQRMRSFVDTVSTGNSKTYAWTGVKPATYLYHSGTHPQKQVQMGLYGAVKGQSDTAYDHEATLFYSEVDPVLHAAVADGTYGTAGGPTSTIDYNPTYFLVNGGAGDTPIAAGSPGERTLVRFLNAGLRTHAPVVHGQYLSLVAEDGNTYPYAKEQYSVPLPAMKTVDAILTPTAMGLYAVQNRMLDPTGGMLAKLDVAGAASGAPVATADVYATDEDAPLAVPSTGVLANDSGSSLSAVLMSGPAHGTLTLGADGSFTYTPNANYFGPDSFTYKAVQGAQSSTATASITVNPVNDDPVAANDGPYNGTAGIVLNIPAPGVLANDTDADGNTLTAQATTPPAGVTLNPDGSISVASTVAAGTFSFAYNALDGNGGTDSAQVTIALAPSVNHAPVANNDSATTKMNTAVIINVIANDTDVDGNLDPASVTIATAPNRGGTAVPNANGTVTYTPKLNYRGTDSFSYTVKDTAGAVSRRASVRVNVTK